MEESKTFLFLSFETLPVIMHSIQENGSTYNICHDKGNRPVNRAINMRFSSEMDDTIWLEVIYCRLNQLGVGYIAFYKLVAFMASNRSKVIQVSGVGELIQVEDVVVCLGDLLQDEVGADEARAAGDDYSFQVKTPLFNSNIVA